ncbi:MAG: S8 family serine peptidase [Patescibacteria group bacterium]|nr:S8 family serine peptidase [Patescibacteria group bacterium]
MPKNNLLKQVVFFLIALPFAAGQFSLAPTGVSAKAIVYPHAKKNLLSEESDNQNNFGVGAKKSIVPERNSDWEFEEYEAVVKIDCVSCLDSIAEKHGVSLSPLGDVENENFYLARSLTQKPARKLVKALEKDRDIELVQPNFKYKPLARLASDAYYSEQWWLFDSADNAGGVSAASAWDLETKSQRDVAVAVIDSGANTRHKDLKKNLTGGSTKGKNFEYPKRKPTDSDGHGSFLAGIIAARSNNRRGVAGASFYDNLKVMPLRFDFTTSQAIEALNFAKSKNVMVVNASWGSYGDEGYDLALKDAISQYSGVFITASGNEGYNHDGGNANQKMYPCDFDLANIICVGASDQNGNLADYSDYGATSVDVAAPGGSDGYPLIGLAGSKSGYDEAEGSSLSAAFVSAEAGLLFSKYPNLSGAQVIEIVKNSVDTNASLSGKVLSGGKVNFSKALQAAAEY